MRYIRINIVKKGFEMLRKSFFSVFSLKGKEAQQGLSHADFGNVQTLMDESFDIMKICAQKAMEQDDLQKVDEYITDFFAEIDVRTMEVHNAATFDKNVTLTLDQAVALDDYYHKNMEAASDLFDELSTREDFKMMREKYEDMFQRSIDKLTQKTSYLKERLSEADAKVFGTRKRKYNAPAGSEFSIGEPS